MTSRSIQITLTFLFLSLFESCLSQDIRNILIYKGDTTIRTSIITTDPKIDIKVDRIYHWYDSEKLFKNRGGYYGNLINGEYLEFNKTGHLIISGYFKEGLKEGKWIFWNSEGEILYMQNFRKGKFHGKYYTFSESEVVGIKKYFRGILKKEWLFENSKKIPVKEKELRKENVEETPKEKRFLYIFKIKKYKTSDDL